MYGIVILPNEVGDTSRTKCIKDEKCQKGSGNTKSNSLPKITTERQYGMQWYYHSWHRSLCVSCTSVGIWLRLWRRRRRRRRPNKRKNIPITLVNSSWWRCRLKRKWKRNIQYLRRYTWSFWSQHIWWSNILTTCNSSWWNSSRCWGWCIWIIDRTRRRAYRFRCCEFYI